MSDSTQKLILDWIALFELAKNKNEIKDLSKIQVMSKDDNDWIQKQMDSVKFDDEDSLKIIIDNLKNEVTESNKRRSD